MGARGRLPREPRGVFEPAGPEVVRAGERLEGTRRDRRRIVRVEQDGRIADDLGERARARRGDRAPARHRLDRRQAEPLVEAREDERRGALVERDELRRRDGAAALDPIRLHGVVAGAGEDESQLRSRLSHEPERLEQPGVVLVRPGPRRIEEERLTVDRRIGREQVVVDAEVDRVHTCGVEPEPLDNPAGDPVADHDHAVSAPCGGVVRQTAEEALTAREESGQVEVLDVEEGQHGRPPGGRHGDGERVVDDVGALEVPSRRSRPEPGAPHRAEPPRRRRRGTVSRGDDGPEPVAGVRRERGHERLVLVLPDPREKARELSRVPLLPPEIPGTSVSMLSATRVTCVAPAE